MMLTALPAIAQEKQVYQIKTLNQQLQPVPNITISLNEKKSFLMNEKGLAFIELDQSELPVKSIQIKDNKLEAASWNLTKGILEIIIRMKSYQIVPVHVRNSDNSGISNVKVTFNGIKTLSATTDQKGKVEFPLSLEEKVSGSDQFKIEGYNIKNIVVSNDEVILNVETSQVPVVAKKDVREKQSSSKEYFDDFDLSKLDSIKSLTVFYAIFKNYQIRDMKEETREKIDDKFQELVGQLRDSLNRSAITIINNISDTTYLEDDIQNLLSQARVENQMLESQQSQFEEKMQVVNDKLEVGFENLNEAERESLLKDLNMLEKLLLENESRFYKNQSNYRQMVSSLKERFFDMEALETKLFMSENQRLEEQRVFRQRLFIILFVTIIFAIMVILLIYFSNKLKKQKKELEVAHGEVQRINENLENIVYERTKMLEETNKELDTVLYRASHDLRSPICSIVGLCNLASSLSSSKENNELFHRMIETTETMDKLLKKLSIISEINQPGANESIYLSELIESTENKFGNIIRLNKVNFVVQCPDDLRIYSNPNLLEVILTNLIDNALFYCIVKKSNDYRVILNASLNEGNLEISLYDNGIGVDKTISNKLFEMFFRGHEYSKGNGLGLYIVQKSVQVLNGKITVESEPGKFSKFVVHIPIEESRDKYTKMPDLKVEEVHADVVKEHE